MHAHWLCSVVNYEANLNHRAMNNIATTSCSNRIVRNKHAILIRLYRLQMRGDYPLVYRSRKQLFSRTDLKKIKVYNATYGLADTLEQTPKIYMCGKYHYKLQIICIRRQSRFSRPLMRSPLICNMIIIYIMDKRSVNKYPQNKK